MVGADIEPQAVFDYLLMHMIPAPATVFAGVRKLRAATCLLFDGNRLSVRKYWQPTFRLRTVRSRSDLNAELFAALRNAVRATAPNDRTGCFLSGGLDSSTVAGLLNELQPSCPTFSIGFGYEDYDELAYARIANRHFGCTGNEYTINGDDIVAAFPMIARAYDEPFGNSSALPAYYCARLAKDQGIKHLLAGDGGD
ncbi:MAG: asparagine synthase C-terminal domain-containing protein, partial [Steroidobacteraceae bacterium]|nr:asparagine synthase C-terminal domain-containing protein [Steroidobacteraceae bacterium]